MNGADLRGMPLQYRSHYFYDGEERKFAVEETFHSHFVGSVEYCRRGATA